MWIRANAEDISVKLHDRFELNYKTRCGGRSIAVLGFSPQPSGDTTISIFQPFPLADTPTAAGQPWLANWLPAAITEVNLNLTYPSSHPQPCLVKPPFTPNP